MSYSGATAAPIIAVGEALWDLLPGGAVLGGAPLNFCYRIEELGIPAYLVSAVGSDELGDRALREILRKGMRADFIPQLPNTATGTVEVVLDDQRNPTYTIIENVAYDRIPVNNEVLDTVRTCAAVCYGTLVQRSPQSHQAVIEILKAGKDAERIYDVNLRPRCYTRETIHSSLEFATIVKVNDEEADTLAKIFGLNATTIGGFAEGVFARYPAHTVVVTMGGAGAVAIPRNGVEAYHPGFSVVVDDPCGAGDAFTAGFVTRFLSGAALETALEYGNALGAVVATQRGATERVTPEETRALIDRGAHTTKYAVPGEIPLVRTDQQEEGA